MPTVWRANIGYQADLDFGSSPFGRGWHINLDYIYSLYKNPFNDRRPFDGDRHPQGPATGLAVYVDGRPIYATIDPLRAGCTAKLRSIDSDADLHGPDRSLLYCGASGTSVPAANMC